MLEADLLRRVRTGHELGAAHRGVEEDPERSAVEAKSNGQANGINGHELRGVPVCVPVCSLAIEYVLLI